jgi:hypothetical protein
MAQPPIAADRILGSWRADVPHGFLVFLFRLLRTCGLYMENRVTPRLRTLKGGSILYGVAPSIDCVIKNMSPTGALLAVESAVGIPDDFTLLIKPELTKRDCKVIWRAATKIGVRFC